MKSLIILFLFSTQAFAALVPETYHIQEDGNDDLPSFQRLLSSFECSKGCRIELAPRQYLMSDTLKLCRSVVMQGAGERVTEFIFPSGKTGIYVAYACADGNGAAGSMLENFSVTGVGSNLVPTFENPLDSAMIEVKTGTVTLRNIRTNSGRHGVRISAGIHRLGDEKSLANHWRLDQVTATGSHHAGILIDGPDSNAGNATGVSASNSCRFGNTLKALSARDIVKFPAYLQQCAGIYDSSFLGNTWVGPHVAGIIDDQTLARYPGYIADGDNQHTVFMGAYIETNSGCGILSARSYAQGGISCWTGPGLYFNTNTGYNMNLVQPTILSPALGTDSLTGSQRLMSFRFPGATAGSRIDFIYDQRHRADGVTPQYAPGHDALSLKVDGLNAKTITRWSLAPVPTPSASP